MTRKMKNLLKKENGMGTVEIILIIAILVGLALLFKGQITTYVKNIMKPVTNVTIDPKDVAK